jgi:outer membrane protein assembly factor BamB
MRRLLKTWRSWPVDRRAAAIVTALLVAGSFVVVGYTTVKRPADKSCPPPCSLQVERGGGKEQPTRHNHAEVQTVDWPVFGFDQERTKYLPSKTVVPPFKPVWGWDSGELLEFSPIVARGVVYGINTEGLTFALDADNGDVLWKRDIGGLSANSPAYDHGRLFVNLLAPDESVAMRARDGKVLWRHQLSGRSESSPVVYHGRVIFGCECATVYALDSKDGSEVWTTHTTAEVKAAVAISKGTAYVGDYAGIMYALDAGTGAIRWTSTAQGSSFGVAGRLYSTPAVAFGRVYVGSVDDRVYSFDAQTGSLAWSQSTGDWIYGGVVAADPPDAPPTVFAGSFDNHAYAFDARTGSVLWSKDVGGIISGAGSVIGNSYYVSTLASHTFGLNVANGDITFEVDRGQYNPAISDGVKLYLTGYSGVTAYVPKEKKGGHGKGGKHNGGRAKKGK